MSQHALDYPRTIPDVVQALQQVGGAIGRYGLDRRLLHLVWLRASQINGCAFCVDMHTREARADGESNQRLDRLVVWQHVADFSAQERAALAWTEAITRLDAATDYGALRAALRQHFSEQEVAALTATAAMINLWNRVQVAAQH